MTTSKTANVLINKNHTILEAKNLVDGLNGASDSIVKNISKLEYGVKRINQCLAQRQRGGKADVTDAVVEDDPYLGSVFWYK